MSRVFADGRGARFLLATGQRQRLQRLINATDRQMDARERTAGLAGETLADERRKPEAEQGECQTRRDLI